MAKPAESTHARKKTVQIDPSQWPKIRKRRQAGETYATIAAPYGVTPASIWFICRKTEKQVREKLAKPTARKLAAGRTNGSKAKTAIKKKAQARVDAPRRIVKTPTQAKLAARLNSLEAALRQNLEQLAKVREGLLIR